MQSHKCHYGENVFIVGHRHCDASKNEATLEAIMQSSEFTGISLTGIVYVS